MITGVLAVAFAATIAVGLWPSAWSAGPYAAAIDILAFTAIVVGLALEEVLALICGIAGLVLVAVIGVQSVSLPTFALPFVGGAVLAVAELGHWSLELQSPIARSDAVLARRAIVTFILVAAGTALSGLAMSSLLALGLL